MTYSDLFDLQSDISVCRRCAEAGYEIHGLPVFSGLPGVRWLLIGQAPGITEAELRRPFNGDAGRRLFRWLGQAGWEEADFRERCYITSVTKCYPGKAKSGGGDRVPTAAERALCAFWLEREIAFVQPEVIIVVGRLAASLFFPKSRTLTELIGTCERDAEGRRIIPLPHPSGASRWHQDPHNVGKLELAITQIRRLKLELDS